MSPRRQLAMAPVTTVMPAAVTAPMMTVMAAAPAVIPVPSVLRL
jgi:hypothetical protein